MKLDSKKKEMALRMHNKADDKAVQRSVDKHWSKKGRESLNRPRGEKNEGETMYLGKNERNRS